MKIPIIFFFLVFSTSFNSYGGWFDKTICVETDAQLRKSIIFLPNKTKPFTGNNLCEYENGQHKTKGEIKDGKKDGKWFTWHENGLLKSEENYKNGKRDGKQISFNFDNLNYKSEMIYKYGRIQKFIIYYESGKKKSEADYKNGVPNGKRIHWHENGQIMMDINIKDDKRHGQYTTWDEDGKLKRKKCFKNGKEINKHTGVC